MYNAIGIYRYDTSPPSGHPLARVRTSLRSVRLFPCATSANRARRPIYDCTGHRSLRVRARAKSLSTIGGFQRNMTGWGKFQLQLPKCFVNVSRCLAIWQWECLSFSFPPPPLSSDILWSSRKWDARHRWSTMSLSKGMETSRVRNVSDAPTLSQLSCVYCYVIENTSERIEFFFIIYECVSPRYV